MIGVVVGSAGGRATAEALNSAWAGEVRVFEGGRPADLLRAAVDACGAVVAFLPVDVVARVLVGHPPAGAPVVCVDESLRFAFALVGEHQGAYRLAQRLSAALGCVPVSTGAGNDAPALADYGADLGFTIGDPTLLPHVEAAILAGEPVGLEGAEGWPLPALPANVGAHEDPVSGILVTDEAEIACMCHEGWFGNRLVLRPPSLVVGVGTCAGTSAEEIAGLVDAALGDAALAPGSVRWLATVDVKADEPGLREFAGERGWRVVGFPADVLARVDVPNPTDGARARIGTPSVAEAAALCAARSIGRSAELVVEKRKSAHATAAVARLAPRGRLTAVGLGPGDLDLVTPRAVAALRRASLAVAVEPVTEIMGSLLRPGTLVLTGEPGEAAALAVAEAARGRAVALVAAGDAPEVTAVTTAVIECEKVPGITGFGRSAAGSCNPVMPIRKTPEEER